VSPEASLALLRIEQKLDLLLHHAAAQDPVLHALLQAGTGMVTYQGDLCPLCRQQITIHTDFRREEYVRRCGCAPPSTPVVPGISVLNEPIVEKKPTTPDTNEGVQEDVEEQDRGPR